MRRRRAGRTRHLLCSRHDHDMLPGSKNRPRQVKNFSLMDSDAARI